MLDNLRKVDGEVVPILLGITWDTDSWMRVDDTKINIANSTDELDDGMWLQWDTSEPSDSGNCVELDINGKLKDLLCTSNAARGLCEIKDDFC